MSRTPVGLVLGALLALLAVGTIDFAHAAFAASDDIGSAALPASAAPQLLGPIDALGRNGWQCFPERAASARTARAADLPNDDRP